ncbi:site-specific integrase [Ferroglobus sp.]|uniref:tyrosine-type recombinase/integrase n=1 Tax=Ferroglobus sp. TaxID=2614230 RepID=UPI0025C25602|nr:site-specific integrase [Ferroglobus sp.]
MKAKVDMDKWRSIDYESRLLREIEKLKKSKISNKNKKLIIKYKNHRLANGVSAARVHREIQSLRLLCENHSVELDEIDDESLDEILANLELSGAKLSTINEYKKALKYFLKFLGKEDLAEKIKRKEPTDNDLTRDDLLTVDEVLKLVSVAMNERDPALIMCHLDLACRPEEILTLTVGDFVRDSWGIRVELRRSKTFRRSPHLSFSLPYVSRWLNVHPLKNDPEAPMWLDLNAFRKGIVKPIDNNAYNRILDKLFKRAGIQKRKRFSPYKLRHTGITLWSTLLTEQQLSRRSGHIPGSKHLKRYTKLIDEDTDKKILGELNIINEREAEHSLKQLKFLHQFFLPHQNSVEKYSEKVKFAGLLIRGATYLAALKIGFFEA